MDQQDKSAPKWVKAPWRVDGWGSRDPSGSLETSGLQVVDADGYLVTACTLEGDTEQEVATVYLIAAAPELYEEVEREYATLADITNEWPGRNTLADQKKLVRLRDLIAKATGRSAEDVQNYYSTRNVTGSQQ